MNICREKKGLHRWRYSVRVRPKLLITGTTWTHTGAVRASKRIGSLAEKISYHVDVVEPRSAS